MKKVTIRVNGRPISEFDFENAVQGYAMELHRKTMDQLSPEELKEIRKLAEEKLIARELIYQEALAQGVVADEEAVAREKAKIISNFPSEEEFYATLAKAGIDAPGYHRMIRQDLTVNLLTEKRLSDLEEPPPEEVERVFREYPRKMKRPARVRASHILVKVGEGGREDALTRIEEIRKRAAGEDFAALARECSECPSGHQGGDLGFFKRGDMVKAFEEAAFALPVGEVGGPVETQFGFHLLKVIDREEETPMDFEEAAPKVRKFLREEAGGRVLAEWVEELKAKAEIEVRSD